MKRLISLLSIFFHQRQYPPSHDLSAFPCPMVIIRPIQILLTIGYSLLQKCFPIYKHIGLRHCLQLFQ